MSGLTDALGGFADWAESVPGAAEKVGKAVARYPKQVAGAVGDINRGYQQDISGPVAQWFGLTGLAASDEEGKRQDPSAAPITGNEAEIGGKKYKFKEVSANPYGNIEDYAAQQPNELIGPVVGSPITKQLEKVLGGTQNPEDISPHEYAALTKAASKGNKLAQQILVKGKFKAQDYPTLAQDLKKVEDPFVQALSGMPALAEQEQAAANKVTQPYDFTNAESQVNNLLGQMGSTNTMTTSPETNTYLGKLNSIVGEGKNNLNTSTLGLPSIMQALGGLGPAGKAAETATPYASLLGALLSHQQYQTIYGGASPASTGDPAWLQQLIAAVTGTGVGGGLVSPQLAAGSVGTTPSVTATPTGSNG